MRWADRQEGWRPQNRAAVSRLCLSEAGAWDLGAEAPGT